MPAKRRALFTSASDSPAPTQFCPTCDEHLTYALTVLNGVSPSERWDYYVCRRCGPYEYRHRTRRLRRTDMLSVNS